MSGVLRLAVLAMLAAIQAQAQEKPQAPAQDAPSLPADQQRAADSQTQLALRRVLGVLMQQHGDLTGKVPASLNDADIAMREAARALESGDDAAATAAIQRAIEALQKGGRAMTQQLAQQFGSQQDEDEDSDDEEDSQTASNQDGSHPGEGQDGQAGGRGRSAGRGWFRDGHRSGDRRAEDRRDPLGRRLREDGTGHGADEGGVRVPDQMEQARSHAIQEELRRREAEKTRPQPELDYIERLLRQF